jgi:hypothetical protein
VTLMGGVDTAYTSEIVPERLTELVEGKLSIDYGAHSDFAIRHNKRMCLMEAVSYITGERKIGDHPKCVQPIFIMWGTGLNDSVMNQDIRQKILKNTPPKLVNTRTTIEGMRHATIFAARRSIREGLRFVEDQYGGHDQIHEEAARARSIKLKTSTNALELRKVFVEIEGLLEDIYETYALGDWQSCSGWISHTKAALWDLAQAMEKEPSPSYHHAAHANYEEALEHLRIPHIRYIKNAWTPEVTQRRAEFMRNTLVGMARIARRFPLSP